MSNVAGKSPGDPARAAAPVIPEHEWGQTQLINGKELPIVVIPLKEDSIAKKFDKKFSALFKKDKPDQKPGKAEIRELAQWALTHGLNDKFVDLMNRIAEVDKDDASVVAFLKVKADLETKLEKEDASSSPT